MLHPSHFDFIPCPRPQWHRFRCRTNSMGEAYIQYRFTNILFPRTNKVRFSIIGLPLGYHPREQKTVSLAIVILISPNRYFLFQGILGGSWSFSGFNRETYHLSWFDAHISTPTSSPQKLTLKLFPRLRDSWRWGKGEQSGPRAHSLEHIRDHNKYPKLIPWVSDDAANRH